MALNYSAPWPDVPASSLKYPSLKTAISTISSTILYMFIAGLIVAFIAVLWVFMAVRYPRSRLWTCGGCCTICLGPSCMPRRPREDPSVLPSLDSPRKSNPSPAVSKAFLYGELLQATGGFSPSNLIGEGGYAWVYKGTIAGNLVAVKKLKQIGSKRGEKEFRAEMEIISSVHHRHLVSLVGYCISDNDRLLVLKYVPNGTLEEALHGPGKPVMDWATRMNIAIGTARGLAYLHEDCRPKIMHRDIKGSNILLDNHWQAQVADFGLAKLADEAKTHMTTRVVGTFGYMAPEYAMSGSLTDKSDVYSFGVVLLELITSKKAVVWTSAEAQSLVEWARPRLAEALKTRNLDALAAENLRRNYEEQEMFRMVEVAALCVRRSSRKRPKMADVLRRLSAKHGDVQHQADQSNESAESAGHALSDWSRLVHSSSSTTQSSNDHNRTESSAPSPVTIEVGSTHQVYPATALIFGSDNMV